MRAVTVSIRRYAVPATAFTACLCVTAGGMLATHLPLWTAGLPLLMAIGIGTRSARAVSFGAWVAVPAAICARGLVGLGFPPELVVPAAMAVTVILAWTAALAGVGLASLAVTLIPPFPASPVIPLADMLPALGPAALAGAAAALFVIEVIGSRVLRWGGVLALALALGIWKATAPFPPPPEGWVSMSVPTAVTERGRWIAIRNALRPGTTAALGEAVISADDPAAVSFWCRAVTDRDLTLYIGVTESYLRSDRGAVRRFDRSSCADGRTPGPVARAWIGIPGLTGGWTPMPGAFPSSGDAPHFLICLEAFLPWAWFRTHTDPAAAPIIVISNDGAFGDLPVPSLRRKATAAMAGMLGIPALHAETGLRV